MKSPRWFLFSGFSLTEVVLALGLVSVGVLSVVGLLGTSLLSNRQSQDEVVLASMSIQVVTELRSARFEALPFDNLRENGTPGDSVFYFSVNGDRVDPGATGVSHEAIYECRVKKTPDAGMQGVSGGEHNLVQVDMHFSWPVSANGDPGKRPGQSRIHTSIARYE